MYIINHKYSVCFKFVQHIFCHLKTNDFVRIYIFLFLFNFF